MKSSVIALSLCLSVSGCTDPKAERDLADAKKELADREEDLEASQKKLKAAESAENAAEERAKLAETKLKESDAKLKEAEAKLKAQPATDVSDPSAPAPSGGPVSSGNATCDKYWTKMRACNEAAVKSAPASVQEQIRKAMADAEKQTKEAWSQIGDSTALGAACQAALDALAQNPNCPKQ